MIQWYQSIKDQTQIEIGLIESEYNAIMPIMLNSLVFFHFNMLCLL